MPTGRQKWGNGRLFLADRFGARKEGFVVVAPWGKNSVTAAAF
jgi:hypothetical protein